MGPENETTATREPVARRMRGTLTWKFAALSLSFGLLYALSVAVNWWGMEQRRTDTAVISAASQLPVFSQKVARDALSLATGDGKVSAFELRRSIEVFDMTLNAVSAGGDAPIDVDMTEFVSIQQPEDEAVIAAVDMTRKLWFPLAERLQKVLNGSASTQEVTAVQVGSTRLLGLSSGIVVGLTRASEARAQRLFWLQTGAFGLAVLIYAIIFAAYTSRSIAAPIRRLVELAERISSGDLAGESIEVERNDEIGTLVSAFARMRDELRTMMTSMRDGVTTLAGNVSELRAAAKQYAATASEQAASLAEMTATISEISQTSQSAAEASRTVQEAADVAAVKGHEGRDAVKETSDAMGAISDRVTTIASEILHLSEQTNQIGEIVESVRDLADQSNLLAVNANIEAAKAGEHGKGFAVVATEVRSLADQSKAATLQIRGILGEIQGATSSAVMITEEGTKRADDGGKRIAGVSSIIDILASTLEENADGARQIAGAASQQAAGISQIASALTNLEASSRQTADGVRSLEESASRLASFSEELDGMVARYSL